MSDQMNEEQFIGEGIEKCIGIRGNRAYDGSYAAPREAFREVIRAAIEYGKESGRREVLDKYEKIFDYVDVTTNQSAPPQPRSKGARCF